MRYLSILILITTISCRENRITPNSPELNLKVSLSKDYYVPFDGQINYETTNDKILEKIFQVKIALINNSDTDIELWMMKCSWWFNFLINNYYINFADSIGCDANFPTTILLKANDSIIFNTRLSRDIQIDNPVKYSIGFFGNEVQETKIGFIIIDSTICKSHDQYFQILHDKSKWGTIIWSNPLYLLR